MPSAASILREIYDALLTRFGHQEWWPAESAFEVMVGAVLAQNTNWKNVEKAIANLKREDLLEPLALDRLGPCRLARLIRPAGCYNVKAQRLANLVRTLVDECGGDLDVFFQGSVDALRERLLGIKGIGPETADSIILYAGRKPTFVVDAYTYRLALRHNLVFENPAYDELKGLFEDNLPCDVALFNEYHALIVRVGKEFCRKTALCEGCPLESFPHWTD